MSVKVTLRPANDNAGSSSAVALLLPIIDILARQAACESRQERGANDNRRPGEVG